MTPEEHKKQLIDLYTGFLYENAKDLTPEGQAEHVEAAFHVVVANLRSVGGPQVAAMLFESAARILRAEAEALSKTSAEIRGGGALN